MSNAEFHPQRSHLPVLRILDANFNRASEGLRVVEEYVRFVLDDSLLAAVCKSLRHGLEQTRAQFPQGELSRARDTVGDVGTQISTTTEYQRPDLLAVVAANLKRLEQALRVLEEYGKTVSADLGKQFETLRYQTYTLEKQIDQTSCPDERLQAARLYVLIDGGQDSESLARQVTQLVEAGVHILQLRDKQLGDRELLARAKIVRQLTRGHCLFIMNDRPDLAVLADADGVHIGQDELTVKDARTIVGPRAIVGVSTHSLAQARQAVTDGADYIGCGPTFPSTTKDFTDFPGLAFLREVAAEIRTPAFAIGGITLERLDDVLNAGFSRVAVSGAITNSAAPTNAIKQFLNRLMIR